jgi:hypothetical protein
MLSLQILLLTITHPGTLIIIIIYFRTTYIDQQQHGTPYATGPVVTKAGGHEMYINLTATTGFSPLQQYLTHKPVAPVHWTASGGYPQQIVQRPSFKTTPVLSGGNKRSV